MRYTISGEIAQSVRLEIAPGEFVWCSKGSLMALTPGIQWNLRVPGGLGGAVRRSLSGEGIALTYLQTDRPDQHVLLAANAPGHLEVWDLESDGPVTTTRGSFLCAWGDDLDIWPRQSDPHTHRRGHRARADPRRLGGRAELRPVLEGSRTRHKHPDDQHHGQRQAGHLRNSHRRRPLNLGLNAARCRCGAPRLTE